jgi:hypothetical protein
MEICSQAVVPQKASNLEADTTHEADAGQAAEGEGGSHKNTASATITQGLRLANRTNARADTATDIAGCGVWISGVSKPRFKVVRQLEDNSM